MVAEKQTRRTHTKSRRGCLACKKRHVKPIQPLSLSATAFSSTPGSSRLLELELMHRWSTKTWASLYSVPDDQFFLQEHLPRTALFESYMMNGLFALAAADLASSGRPEYLPIAYEYSTMATADYQVALQRVSRDNVHGIYAFAMMANIFNFSMPALSPSALTRMKVAFDTVAGASDYIMTYAHWRPPCSSLVRSGSLQPNMGLLSSGTRSALDRLRSLSRQIRVPASFAGTVNNNSSLAADVRVYQLAISHIENSFAEDAEGKVKGYCFCICDVVPPEYMAALKACEPMALLILMYYGVVVNQSSNIMMWWIKSTGKDLVAEVAAMLQETSIARMSDAQEAISWAREEVGLPGYAAPNH
ncbi:PKS-NRPS hybrid synthetase [Purpureocillium lavendulum]|uniref:PKS-NRPS hybrid synthetase n=1 Tax=Purpureocillium lavendulum TaxID=1247861 RepID=A0AB34FEF3_9HYPO|nr:PKS-NRPS hybrid synthetase [Purpureocillium lavendulum]